MRRFKIVSVILCAVGCAALLVCEAQAGGGRGKRAGREGRGGLFAGRRGGGNGCNGGQAGNGCNGGQMQWRSGVNVQAPGVSVHVPAAPPAK